jgi:predicted enzyme related to lactoylglutathione lyase
MNTHLVILAVEDLARSKAFYDAAFGWKVGADVPVYVEYRVAPGFGVGLYLRSAFAVNTGVAPSSVLQGAITSTEIYIRVDDLPTAVARLEGAGARLLSPAADRPWGERAAYFADPDGNVVAVAIILPEA